VKRIGHRRYSETVTSVKTGDAYISTVGDICRRLAYERLVGAFWELLPEVEGKDGYINLPVDVGVGDLATWRKEPAPRSLYELQIEVCEKAIEALAKSGRVSQAQKDQSRKKIEAEIEKLKKTKQPARVLGGNPTYEERGKYNAEVAKRVRDGIKSGKAVS